MSRLPEQIVRLSVPFRNRWYNGHTYCTGIVASNEIADGIHPMVSSYIQPALDEDCYEVFEVHTVYAYNSKVAREDQTWHVFVTKQFPTMREALKDCESACREAYAFALENGINKVLLEQVQ